MGDDRYNRQRGRRRGHPMRGFRDAHPTPLWSILPLIVAGLIVITMRRLVLAD